MLIQKDVKRSKPSPSCHNRLRAVLLNRREEGQMKNIIKWFVLLMHKDMQNFEMNEDTDCSVRKQIMNRTNRKKEGERLG